MQIKFYFHFRVVGLNRAKLPPESSGSLGYSEKDKVNIKCMLTIKTLAFFIVLEKNF